MSVVDAQLRETELSGFRGNTKALLSAAQANQKLQFLRKRRNAILHLDQIRCRSLMLSSEKLNSRDSGAIQKRYLALHKQIRSCSFSEKDVTLYFTSIRSDVGR